MSLNKRLFTGAPLPGASLENAFSTFLYNGNNSSQSLTGLGFKPDLIWIKQRHDTNPHLWMDSTRGAGKMLQPHTTSGQTGNSGNFIGSFDSDGFQVNRNYLSYTAHDTTNYGIGDNAKYVAWCWRANEGSTSSNTDGDITSTVQANQAAGFSISTYVNNGSNSARVGHGLGATPAVVLIKKYNQTASWHLMTTAIDGSFDDIILNDNGAKANSSLTAPTSTTFAAESGGNNEPMICYAWAPIPGYSKFGSYTGNGSTTGPTVTLGFAPGLLIVRKVGGDRWIIADSKRDTSNPNDKFLDAQDTHVESTLGLTGGIDFLSNGFQLKTTDGGGNANNEAYFYMAWREAP